MRNKQRAKREPRCFQVVRGKQRAQFEARTCVECEQWLRREVEDRGGDVDAELKRLTELVCKHREDGQRPQTPDNFYRMTFDETQTQPP